MVFDGLEYSKYNIIDIYFTLLSDNMIQYRYKNERAVLEHF